MGAQPGRRAEPPGLSVVVPVYNEERILPALMARLVPVLAALDCGWEILLVDDGSTDGSWAVMHELRQQDARITVVGLSRNFGHQTAITAGLDHARGAAVVVMDADLQDPPEVIPEMMARFREGYDVVYGVRSSRTADSLFKRSTSWSFYAFLGMMVPPNMPILAGDFRLMSRRTVLALQRMPERGRYLRGMVAWLGYRQIGVTFERDPRVAGVSKYPLMRMIMLAIDGVVSFSKVPLRLSSALGCSMAALALIYVGYAVVMKASGATVQGWTSLVAVVVFIGSAQLLCLGIIGEYVGRIHDEVKGRPLYFVENLGQGDGPDHTGSIRTDRTHTGVRTGGRAQDW